MESRAIAVSETVTLPAQPTTGNLTFVPLGGDGYTSPRAAYALVNHKVVGDAGGGAATLEVVLDDRFTSLVSFVSVESQQVSSADVGLRIEISSIAGGRQIPQMRHQEVATAISATIAASTISRTWNPPAQLLPGAGEVGRVQFKMINTLNDDYFLSMLVYLFDIRARELTPLAPLLWARGAGAT